VGSDAGKSELLRQLFEAVTDAVVALSSNGVIDYANATARALFGRAEGELHGSSLESLGPEGIRFDREASTTPFVDASGRAQAVRVLRHPTPQQRVEEALRESEQQLRLPCSGSTRTRLRAASSGTLWFSALDIGAAVGEG